MTETTENQKAKSKYQNGGIAARRPAAPLRVGDDFHIFDS